MNEFIEQLVARINQIDGLPIQAVIDYAQADDSIGIYTLPGGNIVKSYMDAFVKAQPIEITGKGNDQQVISKALYLISNAIEQEFKTTDFASDNWTLEKLSILSSPSLNEIIDDKSYVFILDIQAQLYFKI